MINWAPAGRTGRGFPAGSLAFALCAVATVTLGSACHSARPSAAVASADAASNAACALVLPAAASASDEVVQNPTATFDSAWAIVARNHWDTTYNGVNWRLVRDTLRPKAAAARTTGELRVVLSDMIGTLRQSHFSIIPANVSDGETDSRSAEALRDHSGGIGATFRDVDGALMLTAVVEGGPASRAGLRAGYVIDAVDGCAVAPRFAMARTSPDARRVKLNAWSVAHNLLHGPVGDSAHIVARDGSGRVGAYVMAREGEPGTITKFGNLPPMIAHLELERRVVAAKNVGVIRFNIWMPVLADAFNAAMDSLRTSDAIVLDIRGNFGGLGAMSTGVAGHFIDSALTLGTMIQRGSIQRYLVNPQRVDRHMQRVQPYAGPLALVVDELSISTTEIFAAGLQELGRARVFGVQTAGESLPSVAERLPDGDILYHAVANFLSPKGRAVEGAGVRPDVVVPVTRSALLKGSDPALDAAIAWGAKSARERQGKSEKGPR